MLHGQPAVAIGNGIAVGGGLSCRADLKAPQRICADEFRMLHAWRERMAGRGNG